MVGSVFPLIRTTHFSNGIKQRKVPKKGKPNWIWTCDFLVFGRVDVYTTYSGSWSQDIQYGDSAVRSQR